MILTFVQESTVIVLVTPRRKMRQFEQFSTVIGIFSTSLISKI